MNKELNELLPSNLISEINKETEISGYSDENNEEDEEIVDNIGYKPVSNQTMPLNNPKTRFLSDSYILHPQMNQSSTNPQMQMYNLMNQIQMYQQHQYYNQSNPMFMKNANAYVNPSVYPIQGNQCFPMQIERRSTCSTQPGDLNLNREWDFNYNNQPHQVQMKLSSPKRKHFPSSNSILQNNQLKTTKNQKGSLDLSKGQSYLSSHMMIDKFETEEFASYLSSLKCEIFEFLCSQKGARDMQKNLNKSPLQCKTLLINTLKENISKVMVDVYGNYFCQQMIHNSTKEQIMLILGFIKRDFIAIAKDYSGTHVLQAILEITHSQEEQNLILTSIKGFEIQMAYDSNATHVLQKIIVTISEENRCETNEAILANLKEFSLNSNGICLVKKYIGTNHIKEYKTRIIQIITNNCLEIAQNPYGNYAIQYLFEEWNICDYPSIIDILITNIVSLSMQKFSSNVSEKIIDYLSPEKRKELIKELFAPNKLLAILKNKYGRYVLKKVSKSLTEEENETLKPLVEKISSSPSKEKKH